LLVLAIIIIIIIAIAIAIAVIVVAVVDQKDRSLVHNFLQDVNVDLLVPDAFSKDPSHPFLVAGFQSPNFAFAFAFAFESAFPGEGQEGGKIASDP